jgi:mRNA-degrading endonuclease RelE of RelBE toxin-antitoxin system
VKHKTASSFWKYYEHLPVDIRDLADKNFQLLKDNPSHPSLQFKKVGKVWSVRVGSNYRAIATQIEEGYLWIWIGTHAEYDRLLR